MSDIDFENIGHCVDHHFPSHTKPLGPMQGENFDFDPYVTISMIYRN